LVPAPTGVDQGFRCALSPEARVFLDRQPYLTNPPEALPVPRSPHVPLAALALVFACSNSNSPRLPDGEIVGQVDLLAEPPQPPTTGVVQLYTSPSAVEARHPSREAPLVGGPGNWTFQLEGVPPGTYYLGACFSFGCTTHSDIEGHPAPVTVISGETTSATVNFY
jgi:hypothetical protein